MPAAMLLDHHSTTFTPPVVSQQRQRVPDPVEEDDPNVAAELLRQKIEETNQKIADYFKQ